MYAVKEPDPVVALPKTHNQTLGANHDTLAA